MKRPSSKQRRVVRAALHPLAELLKPYPSGWVALTSDEREVVAAGETLHETSLNARRKHVAHAVFVKVIPPGQGYLPELQ